MTHDDVGRHDRLIAARDPWRSEYDDGVTGHRNCSDNFLETLRPYALARHQIPNPVNRFQSMEYLGDGSVVFRASLSAPGNRVAFRALQDVVVAVSACPMDLNPISGYRVTNAEIDVIGEPPTGSFS